MADRAAEIVRMRKAPRKDVVLVPGKVAARRAFATLQAKAREMAIAAREERDREEYEKRWRLACAARAGR